MTTDSIKRKLGLIARRTVNEFLGEDGAVAIENALALPILLLFMYGIVEFSHYVYTSAAVQDAARDGVRYAVVRGSSSPSPATAANIVTYVKGQITLINPASATVNVNFAPNNAPGSVVSVQVSYPYAPFVPGFAPLVGATVSSTSQMTIWQ